MSAAGKFIVLEGPDKCGKSTQAALLADRLRVKGLAVIHTREPGGTSFAEAIRKILLDCEHRVDPLAELLLYEAARAQHTKEKLLPALAAGGVVVAERYTLATLAYQGFARGLDLDLIRRLNHIASFALKPDLTIVLDIPELEFGSRDKSRELDRLEKESEGFRRKVREGYRKLARCERGVVLLNGKLGIAELHERISELVEPLLARKRAKASAR